MRHIMQLLYCGISQVKTFVKDNGCYLQCIKKATSSRQHIKTVHLGKAHYVNNLYVQQ